MSINGNNPPKGLGESSSPFGNPGMVPPAFSQAQLNAGFQAQYQLSQAQAQSKAQAHAHAHAQAQAQAQAAHAQAQAQAQAQAAHAQLQAHLQAQGLSLNQAHNAGIGNLGSSPSMSTPGSANVKRILQKPPMRRPGVPMMNNMSPLRTMELTPAARRKKQKLPEKQLHDRVAAILRESALYTQLLEFEARVDTALARKKVDIQEALKNPPCDWSLEMLKYMDSKHFVPRGNAVVEIVSGVSDGIHNQATLTEGSEYNGTGSAEFQMAYITKLHSRKALNIMEQDQPRNIRSS